MFFTVLTGGLPLDPLRALPWAPEFGRLRDLVRAPAGLATLALVVAPAVGLVALALVASRETPAARRRISFCLAWLAAGTLPLMLPVGTPEAVHLTGALPALFLIWAESLAPRGDRRRAALAAASLLLVAWAGVHVAARWMLFHRDVPTMARAVQALHEVLAQAQGDGQRAHVAFFPAQIGAHYGMIPTVPALYPAAGGGCVRGDLSSGCLVEPLWVWSTLRPWPAVPGACRTAGGLRVGPLTAAVEREIEGSRAMLAHPTTTLTEQAEPRLLGVCPLAGVEPLRIDGTPYLLYRLASGSDGPWYRFALGPRPSLLPVAECDDRPR